MVVQYQNEERKFDLISNYDEFLKKCKNEFQINDEEIRNLKIYKIDEEDRLDIENENDYKDNLEPNDNNEIIFILLSNKTKNLKEELEKIEEENYSDYTHKQIITENESYVVKNSKDGGIDNEEISKFKEEMIKEFKTISNEMEMNIKKVLKRNINDIKSYLIGLGDQILNIQNDLKTLKQNIHISSKNNSNSFQNNNWSLDKEIETLKNKIDKIYIELKNKNNKINDKNEDLLSKEYEDNSEKFYGCNFEKEKIELNYNYDYLIKNKKIKFSLTLLNNGTLSWPKNSMIYGKTKDNELEVKSIINNNNEVSPKQQINPIISLTLQNIKNKDKTYNLPLKLVFPNESSNIKQNKFNLQFSIQKSKKEIDYSINETPKFISDNNEEYESSDNSS